MEHVSVIGILDEEAIFGDKPAVICKQYLPVLVNDIICIICHRAIGDAFRSNLQVTEIDHSVQ